MFPHIPITLDLTKTLSQIDGQDWSEPTGSSHLVITTNVLHQHKLLQEYTSEDLRIMLGQQLNVNELLPLALNQLLDDPSSAGDYYAGDLLAMVLDLPVAVWQGQPQWWTALQFVMYQLEYCLSVSVHVSDNVRGQLFAQWSKLKAAAIPLQPIIQTMIALHQPNTAARDGGFVALYAYDRWHWLTVDHDGESQAGTIRTVHFMQDNGIWRLWSLYRQAPQIVQYQDIAPHFSAEVTKKILPSARYYLPWLNNGLRVRVGDTSDTQITTTVGASAERFVETIQRSMEHEVLGLSLVFP